MLKDKIAVVTGASRGIGKAIALELAKQGADVVVNYSGSKERAMEVKEEIEAMGRTAWVMQCDISDFVACEEFMKEVIKECGQIDILVNNAGITKDGLLMAMKEDQFDQVIAVNLKGCFNCIRFASKYMMKKRNGVIINMSSVSGVLGNAGQANYSASKAGIIGLTKSAARELAARNIRVNAIAPGFVETEMTDALGENVKEEAVKQIPLKRFGKPDDIAAMVAFLAEDKAAYITGQVICVDGGMAI